MSYFDSYNGRLEETAPTAVIVGLVLGLLLQAGFYYTAAQVKIAHYDPTVGTEVRPPAFNLKRVEIDANLLEETEAARPKPQDLSKITEIELPSERIGDEAGPEEIIVAPRPVQIENPDDSRTRAEERRKMAEAVETSAASTEAALRSQMEEVSRKLLDKATVSDRNPKLLIDPAAVEKGLASGASDAAAAGASAGFSNLDALLDQTGPLRRGTAPILMPTDLLFDYNEFQLRPDALESLRKLGELIQRNPHANFTIEGHTDSFGPDEYNLLLSQRRADAVKEWLVVDMRIDPVRIATIGLGKKRPLAPATGTIEQQQLNRRVEIVIRTR